MTAVFVRHAALRTCCSDGLTGGRKTPSVGPPERILNSIIRHLPVLVCHLQVLPFTVCWGWTNCPFHVDKPVKSKEALVQRVDQKLRAR